MLLYLFKCEGIIAALVPVALAVDGMEIEAAGAGGLLPIAALGACDALHVDWSAAGVGVAMPMAMEMLKAAAKAARGCAAKRHAIGTRSGSEPGAAVDRSCRQRTRDRAEGGAPHQGQHDTARAFHDVSFAEAANVADGRAIRQGEGGDFTASCGGFQLRPEKPKACANAPKPPRLTPPDSVAPDDEPWLDESPPKKLRCMVRL